MTDVRGLENQEKGMRKIGVTGGIGSGKSYICEGFRQQGFPVYVCDDEAKRLEQEDRGLVEAIRETVGPDVYNPDGSLNKPVLAKYFLASEENARRINALVHPVVKRDFIEWAARQSAETVYMECAILFESGLSDMVDETVLVTAPLETRIERIMRRDNTTREHALEWINKQMPDEEKMLLADRVIVNG